MPKKKKEIKVPSDPTGDLITSLRSGLQSPFWLAMKEIIQENVDFLDSRIKSEGEEMSEFNLKLLIKWYNLNKEMLTLPESLIESVSGEEKLPKFRDLDPYYKTFE